MGDADVILEARDVRAALAGDREQLRRLLRVVVPVVRVRAQSALSRRGSVQGTDVDDLTQEVLATLFDQDGAALCAWDPARGMSLRSFVGLLAQRRLISHLRSKRNNPSHERSVDPQSGDLELLSTTAASQERSAAARELLEAVSLQLRDELSPQGLDMFYRLYVWEQPVEQICGETGLQRDAVYQWRTRLKRIAGKLRARFETLESTQPDGPAEPAGTSLRPSSPG